MRTKSVLMMLAMIVTFVWTYEKTPARSMCPGGEVEALLSNDNSNPNVQYRVPKAGNVHITISNTGSLGTWGQTVIDPETGLPAPSCNFPAGSVFDYLFGGALWVGAVVGSDTLLSTGADGWFLVHEMFPEEGAAGEILRRSSDPGDPDYSPDAFSDVDYIAVYYDTLTDPVWVTPSGPTNVTHTPMGLRIRQETYSWGDPAYQDFIIAKFVVTNMGQELLRETCFGLYLDTDIRSTNNYGGYIDDISGKVMVHDPASGANLLIGWAADNDGDPSGASWGPNSVQGVIGTALIDHPGYAVVGYNWWNTDANIARDWGPQRSGLACEFPTGGLGTPEGDTAKYCLLSHGERDYDQLWTAVDMSTQGWLPPPTSQSTAQNIADGCDTRFLYSFGPANLPPGDSTQFTIVIALADNFHHNPTDFASLFNWDNPLAFYNALDFSELESHVLTASALYRSGRCAREGIAGDADGSCLVNVSDVVYLILYLFGGGPAPSKINCGDANGDCTISITDAVYLIAYIFSGGSNPRAGCVE